MTPEGKVKDKIKALLKRYGAWYFMTTTAGFGKSGVPDIVGIHKGKGFGIECKAGKGKTTALQDIQLRAIETAGGTALVVNETEGQEALLRFLRDE